MRLPTRGQPLHSRSLTIVLRVGEGGKVHARGDVIDLRKTSFVPMPHGIQPAGIIHHMILEAVVDAETRELELLETAQPFVAVEPSRASKGECCRDPAPRLQALVGQRFGPGFSKELQKGFGGALGCSHLLTLFHLMASALPRGIDLEQRLPEADRASRTPGERFFRRALFVDGHEPEEAGLHLAVQLTDFHAAPFAGAREGLDHFARQDEVRVLAALDMTTVKLTEIVACERSRTRDTLGTSGWQDRSSWVEAFVGRPIMPGLGTTLRQALGEREEAKLLLDSMVQLAPGFVQCTPALTDHLITARAAARAEGRESPAKPSAAGEALMLGGGADSCYMWRKGGPLLTLRMGFEPEDRGD